MFENIKCRFRILLHRSHFGQLAIGGALMEGICGHERAHCSANGGWSTRFDEDFDPVVGALYYEGHIDIWGSPGAYDHEVMREPVAFAAIMLWGDTYYLTSHLGFSSKVAEDGAPDLLDALEVARERGRSTEEQIAREDMALENGGDYDELRDWDLIRKGDVPSRARQVLHRTLGQVEEVLDQFGQGKDFFS